jgi:hypothetical protein
VKSSCFILEQHLKPSGHVPLISLPSWPVHSWAHSPACVVQLLTDGVKILLKYPVKIITITTKTMRTIIAIIIVLSESPCAFLEPAELFKVFTEILLVFDTIMHTS